MYKVFKIENNKLVEMFGKTFDSIGEAVTPISWWYDSVRSNKNMEFLIINQETNKLTIINYDDIDEK